MVFMEALLHQKILLKSLVEDLPAVQVGDPFQEKLLLEATLELAKTDAVVGIQDMKLRVLLVPLTKCRATGKHGMDIMADKVPTRQDKI